MKKIRILVLLLAVAACQSEPDSLEAKQKLLAEKQEQLKGLKDEIRDLKKEVAELDTTSVAEGGTPVRTLAVKPQPFSHFIQLTGTVTSKENIMISAEAGGRVEAVLVNEGENVRAGQLLVRLDNQGAKNELDAAKASYELAEITYQKRKKLWDQSIGSEIEFLQARNNFETSKSRYEQIKTQYQNAFITSPISGTVDDMLVNEGEFVTFGTQIVRVVDLDKVEIEAELSEEYLTHVRKGDSIKVTIPSLGVSTKSTISFVSQVVNPENRSFMIKVKLDNKKGIIKPNVLANIMVRDYSTDTALVVPSISISKDLKGDFVYVAAEENGEIVAAKRYVKRGKSFGAETEITSGLDNGARVIIAGFSDINEGELINPQQL